MKLILLFFLFFSVNLFSQENDLEFLIKKIETIYPGYKDKIKNDGDRDKFMKHVKTVKEQRIDDTLKTLSKITLFFRDRHLLVYEFGIRKNLDTLKDSRKLDDYLNYFTSKRNKKKVYEGFWLNSDKDCIIIIKQLADKPLEYEGIVLQSKSVYATPGRRHFYFEFDAKEKRFLTNCFNYENNSRSFFMSKFVNNRTLIIDNFGKWEKVNKPTSDFLERITARNRLADCKLINSKNFLIRIPENSGANTMIVDSIVKANHKVIKGVENLIIDVRDNHGGTISTYRSLYPYVYTRPIQRLSGFRYSTDEFILDKTYLLEDARKYGDTGRVNSMQKYIDTLVKYKNKSYFVSGSLIKLDSASSYPKRVAIIANYGSMSAAEMMLLEFKQSEKVKIFGERTFGAIDYLDYFPIETPSYKYLLYMPSFRRETKAEHDRLDGVGIKPDVELSDKISDWVKFIVEYYEKGVR